MVGTITEVVPVVQAIARTMEKTHRDKDLAIDLDLPGEARFRGERQDLEEMVGNLVDNACKWASSRVSIEVLRSSRSPAGRRCASSSTTTGRGCRRRSASRSPAAASGSTRPSPAPGSASRSWWNWPALYGGALKLGTAPIGGLRAELVLPAG